MYTWNPDINHEHHTPLLGVRRATNSRAGDIPRKFRAATEAGLRYGTARLGVSEAGLRTRVLPAGRCLIASYRSLD